jgi:hypothetical protein
VRQTFVGIPGSVQRDIVTTADQDIPSTPVPPAQLSDHAMRADIAELAYILWQGQGCPNGSAESDWLAAEQMMRQRVNLG